MYYRHPSDSRGHSPQNALFQLRRQGGAAVGARYRRAVEGLRIEEQARRAPVPRPKTGTASIQPNCRCSPTRNGASNIGRSPKPGISSARSSASPRSVSGVRCGAQLTRLRALKNTSLRVGRSRAGRAPACTLGREVPHGTVRRTRLAASRHPQWLLSLQAERQRQKQRATAVHTQPTGIRPPKSTPIARAKTAAPKSAPLPGST